MNSATCLQHLFENKDITVDFKTEDGIIIGASINIQNGESFTTLESTKVQQIGLDSESMDGKECLLFMLF